MASEAQLRRSASRQVRAGLRKRPASLRRAFNHIFGSDPLTQDQDKSRQQKFEQKLASQVEILQRELAQCRKNLEEARATVLSQDEEISTLEQRLARLEAKLEENKTVLIRQTTALEEGMVAVVVQQIHDARKTEREAVRAKCEREHQTTLESLQRNHKAQIASISQEVQNLTTSKEQLEWELQSQLESLRGEVTSLDTDLKIAKSALTDSDNTLRNVQRESAMALDEANQSRETLKSEFEAQVASINADLAEVQSALRNAEAATEEHSKRYTTLEQNSAKALDDAAQSKMAVKTHLEAQLEEFGTEIKRLEEALQTSSTDRAVDAAAKDRLQEELEAAHGHVKQLKADAEELNVYKADLELSKFEIAHLSKSVQDHAAAKAELERAHSQILELTEDINARVTTISDVEQKHTDAKDRATAAEAAHKTALDELQAVKDSLTAELANLNHAREQNDQLAKAVEVEKDAGNSVKASLETVEQEVRGLQESKRESDAALELAEKTKQSAEDQIAELVAEKTKLTQDLAAAGTMKQTVEDQLVTIEAEKAKLCECLDAMEISKRSTEENAANLEIETTKLSGDLGAAERRISNLESERAKLAKEVDAMKTASSIAEGQIAQLEAAYAARRSDEESLAKLKEELKASQEAKAGIEEKLAAAETAKALAEERATEIQEELDSSKREFEDRLAGSHAAYALAGKGVERPNGVDASIEVAEVETEKKLEKVDEVKVDPEPTLKEDKGHPDAVEIEEKSDDIEDAEKILGAAEEEREVAVSKSDTPGVTLEAKEMAREQSSMMTDSSSTTTDHASVKELDAEPERSQQEGETQQHEQPAVLLTERKPSSAGEVESRPSPEQGSLEGLATEVLTDQKAEPKTPLLVENAEDTTHPETLVEEVPVPEIKNLNNAVDPGEQTAGPHEILGKSEIPDGTEQPANAETVAGRAEPDGAVEHGAVALAQDLAEPAEPADPAEPAEPAEHGGGSAN